MSKKLFVTGTGTDVGKTYISALIVKKLHDAGQNAAYYKAAMSGNERRPDGTLIPGDALWVRKVSGIAQPLEEMCPYVYEHAYSPHLAARIEGNPVRLNVVRAGFGVLSKQYDFVTMEGSGGILCPICWDGRRVRLEDVVRELGMSSVLVADSGLGTINSVVLTAFYMREHRLPVKGLIFNRFHPGDVMEEDNVRMCTEMTGLPVLACVQEGGTELPMSADDLAQLYE